jgi:hypothetical protein
VGVLVAGRGDQVRRRRERDASGEREQQAGKRGLERRHAGPQEPPRGGRGDVETGPRGPERGDGGLLTARVVASRKGGRGGEQRGERTRPGVLSPEHPFCGIAVELVSHS